MRNQNIYYTEASYFNKLIFGCRLKQIIDLDKAKNKVKNRNLQNVYKEHFTKFKAQKAMAKHRDVEWLLSFDEWMNWWNLTGHYEERGRKANEFVMSRFNDVGPYSLSNIFCQTRIENTIEARKIKTPCRIDRAFFRAVKLNPSRRLQTPFC